MQSVALPPVQTPARSSEEDERGKESDAEGSVGSRTPREGKPATKKVRHRKQKQGQTIFKGHPSWAIMNNIKLGVHYTVSKANAPIVDASRPLTMRDFTTEYRQTFPPEGSPQTQAHSSEEFIFRDAAPLAFRHLREHFGVSAEDYMVSICGENNLRELGTPGKSGSVFYLTEDGKYMIKTVSRKESKFLRRILPNYYNYVMRSENTFIPRFFGLIRITTASGRRIRLVVFNNLLPNDFFIHERYDLKGSTLGRWATDAERADPNVTLKDLDFDHTLELTPHTHALFANQVESDTSWLRALHIMDYSLLVLLHFPGREPSASLDGSELLELSQPPPQSPRDGRNRPSNEKCEGGISTISEETSPVTAPPAPEANAASLAAQLGGTSAAAAFRVNPVAVDTTGDARADSVMPAVAASAVPKLPAAALTTPPRKLTACYEGEPPATPSSMGASLPSVATHTDVASTPGEPLPINSAGESSSAPISLSNQPTSLGASSTNNTSSGDTPHGDGHMPDLTDYETSVASHDTPTPKSTKGAEAEPDEDDDLELDRLNLPKMTDADLAAAFLASGTRSSTHGGASRQQRRDTSSASSSNFLATTASGEQVYIFAGVIDILQIYGARKKLEHQYKAMRYRHDRDGISVTDPASYATRMASFVLTKIVRAKGNGDDDEGGTASERLSMLRLAGAPAGRLGEVAALSGTLAKKGTSFPFSWSLRYCEVFASSRTLVYWASEQEKANGQPPRGQRPLCRVRLGEHESPGPGHAGHGGGGGSGPLVLCLETRNNAGSSRRHSYGKMGSSYVSMTSKGSSTSLSSSSSSFGAGFSSFGHLTKSSSSTHVAPQCLLLKFTSPAERDTWRQTLSRMLTASEAAEPSDRVGSEKVASSMASFGVGTASASEKRNSTTRANSSSISGHI